MAQPAAPPPPWLKAIALPALLNAVVCPGAGHLMLGKRKIGGVLIAIAVVAILWWGAVAIALALERINAQPVAGFDFAQSIRDSWSQSRAALEQAAPGAKKLLFTVWMVALIDGLRWGIKKMHADRLASNPDARSASPESKP